MSSSLSWLVVFVAFAAVALIWANGSASRKRAAGQGTWQDSITFWNAGTKQQKGAFESAASIGMVIGLIVLIVTGETLGWQIFSVGFVLKLIGVFWNPEA